MRLDVGLVVTRKGLREVVPAEKMDAKSRGLRVGEWMLALEVQVDDEVFRAYRRARVEIGATSRDVVGEGKEARIRLTPIGVRGKVAARGKRKAKKPTTKRRK